MAIDIIKTIIDGSRNRETAIANFNANIAAGTKLDSKKFYSDLDRKFPITGLSTGSGTGISSGGSSTTGESSWNPFSKITEKINNVIKWTAERSGEMYSTQMGQYTENNLDVVKELFKIVEKGGLDPIEAIKNGVELVYKQALDQLTQEAQLRDQINTSTTLTGELSQGIRDDIKMSSVSAERYGFSMKDVGDLYTGLVDKSGKFSLINRQIMDEAAPVVKAFGTTMADLAGTLSEFEKVGVGTNETIKAINDAGIRSITLGMSGKKTVQDIQMNIGKLNEYGFKNGIQGLETMVRKSNEFRMSMDSVFSIAEKVYSPEGAIDMVANLQVLGGAIGDLNDPLKLMYMSTNNVEGLQDALIGAAGSLATYNQEQGKFEVTGVNLRRAKEMAQQMGISMGELNKISIAAAERTQAASALMLSNLKIEDSDKEFLTNISRMKDGEMKITVPESIAQKLGIPVEVALDKLDQKTANALIKNKEDFEKLDSSEVAMRQLTETQRMSRDMSVVAAYYKVRAAQVLGGVAGGVGIKDAMKELNTTIGKQRDIVLEKRKDTDFQERVEKDVKGSFVGKFIKNVNDFFDDKKNAEKPKENQNNNEKPLSVFEMERIYDKNYNKEKKIIVEIKTESPSHPKSYTY
jgi:hypothetical protein